MHNISTQKTFVPELMGCLAFLQQIIYLWSTEALPRPVLPVKYKHCDLRFAPYFARGLGKRTPHTVPYLVSNIADILEKSPEGEGSTTAAGPGMHYRQLRHTMQIAMLLLEAWELSTVDYRKLNEEIEKGLWSQQKLLKHLRKAYRLRKNKEKV